MPNICGIQSIYTTSIRTRLVLFGSEFKSTRQCIWKLPEVEMRYMQDVVFLQKKVEGYLFGWGLWCESDIMAVSSGPIRINDIIEWQPTFSPTRSLKKYSLKLSPSCPDLCSLTRIAPLLSFYLFVFFLWSRSVENCSSETRKCHRVSEWASVGIELAPRQL